MLDRISVNTLLKSVLAAMAAIAVLLLGLSAWDSAQRLAATGRIEAVADVAAEVFAAMHNLRSDRATTTRDLDIEAEPYDTPKQQRLKAFRDPEMTALRAAAQRLGSIDIAEREQLLTALQHSTETAVALQERSWEALAKPKAERPQGLGKEYFTGLSALLETLDGLSARLDATIKNNDPVIDRMLAMKELAWRVRNTAGDASLTLSTALPTGHLSPEGATKFAAFVAASESLWSAFKDAAFGTDLPSTLKQAIDDADQNYFGGEYRTRREALRQALVAGTPPPMSTDQWAPYTVGHLAYVLKAAVAAIDAAKERAAMLHAAAERDLALQVGSSQRRSRLGWAAC
jgi:hypothetical protein